jgi:acylphosphatase
MLRADALPVIRWVRCGRREYAGGVIRRRVIVHGYVQGVGYRYTARAQASRLGVGGWIRNRADGTVEAEIEGEEASVATLLEWFAQGPPGAIVERTDVSELEPTGDHAFRVTS